MKESLQHLRTDTILMLIMLLIFSSLSVYANAINIKLKKEISPTNVTKGTNLTIRLIIKNEDDVAYNCKILDSYDATFFTPKEKEKFSFEPSDDPKTATSWTYLWIFRRYFTLLPKEEKIFEFNLTYKGFGNNFGSNNIISSALIFT